MKSKRDSVKHSGIRIIEVRRNIAYTPSANRNAAFAYLFRTKAWHRSERNCFLGKVPRAFEWDRSRLYCQDSNPALREP